MHKIIGDNFELDLTDYDITTVEDNQWFSNEFYFNYSFPFSFVLTDDLKRVFFALLDHNAKFLQSKYNVTYVFGNKIEPCVFEIESHIGIEVESVFRYGLEAFPLWDKKLRDFNFSSITITDIYDYAKARLDPLIQISNNPSFEFPLIHTSKYDTQELTWADFEGSINNYDHAFSQYLENTNLPEDFKNKNIMQPCLYLYYILDFCFNEAGFSLKGDIINHFLFKKLLLYASVDFFKRIVFEELLVQIAFVDHVQETSLAYTYDSDYYLSHSKKYKITGEIWINKPRSLNQDYFFKMTYNGNTVYEALPVSSKSTQIKKDINLVLETNTDDTIDHVLNIEISDYKFQQPSTRDYLTNLKVEVILDSGNEVPDEIQNENTIHLKRALPDITFGHLVEETCRLFNLEKTLINSDIHLNFIDKQINYNNTTDLSDFLVLKPKRETNAGLSFIFKCKGDEENKDVVFVDKDNLLFSAENENATTETIEIEAKLMPFQLKNNIFSVADNGDISETDIALIYYNANLAKTGNSNVPQESSELSLLKIYENYYQNWLGFLFQAIDYKWVFKMYVEKLASINKKVFAYGRYHVVKSLEKTQISKDLFEVEIETKTLE